MKFLFVFLLSVSAFANTEVAKCAGDFMGLKGESVNVTTDKKVFRVTWINVKGEKRELDSIKKFNDEQFELQCMNAKDALAHEKSINESEGIHGFLRNPLKSGLLCYFIDETQAKCWAYDKTKKALVEAGGWST